MADLDSKNNQINRAKWVRKNTLLPVSFMIFELAFSTPLLQAKVIPFKVVIDPGHGGSDEGAVYVHHQTRITEKDITLNLSRKIARQLKAKGYIVRLTRASDQSVSLAERTALANQFGADLFISIHMNSADHSILHSANSDSSRSKWNNLHPQAEGVETFILNNTTNASSIRLAQLENSVITKNRRRTLHKLSAQPPPQSDVALILKDLRLDGNLSASKQLACTIQNKLVSATSQNHVQSIRRNRGVKQALFYVLLGADMPSCLVEVGFLGSPFDRSIVLSKKGQLKIGRSIADAVEHFRRYRIQQESPLEGNLPEFRRFQNLTLGRCKVH